MLGFLKPSCSSQNGGCRYRYGDMEHPRKDSSHNFRPTEATWVHVIRQRSLKDEKGEGAYFSGLPIKELFGLKLHPLLPLDEVPHQDRGALRLAAREVKLRLVKAMYGLPTPILFQSRF
jgi:hypothetical protein